MFKKLIKQSVKSNDLNLESLTAGDAHFSTFMFSVQPVDQWKKKKKPRNQPVGRVSSSWRSLACCGGRVWRAPSEPLLCIVALVIGTAPESWGPEQPSSSGATLSAERESWSPPAAPGHPEWGENRSVQFKWKQFHDIKETLLIILFCVHVGEKKSALMWTPSTNLSLQSLSPSEMHSGIIPQVDWSLNNTHITTNYPFDQSNIMFLEPDLLLCFILHILSAYWTNLC